MVLMLLTGGLLVLIQSFGRVYSLQQRGAAQLGVSLLTALLGIRVYGVVYISVY